MKKLAAFALTFAVVFGAIPAAEARVFVGVGYYGYPAYYPAYAYSYPYYYPTYYAPAPVVVAPATVTMVTTPPPATIVAAPTPTLAANQISPTFTDGLGRTCRQFQTTAGVGPAAGTACLMSNGTWQTVQ